MITNLLCTLILSTVTNIALSETVLRDDGYRWQVQSAQVVRVTEIVYEIYGRRRIIREEKPIGTKVVKWRRVDN